MFFKLLLELLRRYIVNSINSIQCLYSECLVFIGMLSVVAPVSYLRITHPSRNFFVLCLYMFLWLRVQGFESSVNKVFQKEKLVNSKTINLQVSLKFSRS